LYADLPWAIKVDLKKVEQEEEEKSKTDYSGVPDASEFRDSLVIFDDTEKMPNVKVEKMLYQLVNVLAQNGRNFGTKVICILHQLNKGLQSSTLLRSGYLRDLSEKLRYEHVQHTRSSPRIFQRRCAGIVCT
jgi:hypothetical protein